MNDESKRELERLMVAGDPSAALDLISHFDRLLRGRPAWRDHKRALEHHLHHARVQFSFPGVRKMLAHVDAATKVSLALFGMFLEQFDVDVFVRRGPDCAGRIAGLNHGRRDPCRACLGTWAWTTQLFGRGSGRPVVFTLHLERDRAFGIDDESRLAPLVEEHGLERVELRERSWIHVDRGTDLVVLTTRR